MSIAYHFVDLCSCRKEREIRLCVKKLYCKPSVVVFNVFDFAPLERITCVELNKI